MNKEEFLKQLEALLSGISEDERTDAMTFYRSYFEDAGEEKEASIIEELGSPQRVAENIRKNLGLEGNGSYYNAFANRDAEYYKNVNETLNNIGKKETEHGSQTAVTVGVVIAVLTSPIWLLLLFILACVLFSLVVCLFAAALSVAAVMAALVFTGFVLFGVGIGALFSGSPAVGLALTGAGLIILALGLLAVILTVWVFGSFLPWALKGLWNLCKKPFEKRKERKAI